MEITSYTGVVVGLFVIMAALLPNPSEYFGEVLFGLKLIKYSYVNWGLGLLGVLDIITSVKI